MSDYTGHYEYNKISVDLNALDSKGVYYCGYLNESNELIPLYIGKAAGSFSGIRSRLLDHLNDDLWFDVTHFGYRLISSKQAIDNIEINDITTVRLNWGVRE